MRGKHGLAVVDWREDAVLGRGMQRSWLWERGALEVVLGRGRHGDGGLRRALLVRLRHGLWLGLLLVLLLLCLVLLCLVLLLRLLLLLDMLLLLLCLLLRLLLSLLVLVLCLLLLVLLLSVLLLLLLDGGRHRLSALFLLHELLHLGVCRRRVCVLELGNGGRSWRRARCHLLGGLGIVEWRVRHVGVVVGRRRGLRGIRLRRREIRARSADMRPRVRPREVVRLRRGAALVEGDAAVGHGRRGRRRRVSDVLEGLRMLQVVRHQGVLGRGVRVARCSALVVVVFIVVAVLLAHKVLGALVLVRAAILRDLSARSSFSAALLDGRSAYILVPANGLVDVARRKLVQLLVVAKDDDGDVHGAQHGELVRLLEQAAFALQKSAAAGQRWPDTCTRGASGYFYLHGAVAVVLDGLDLNLAAAHGCGGSSGGSAHQTATARNTGTMHGDAVGVAWVEGSARNKRSRA
jgi:hypothetical protein